MRTPLTTAALLALRLTLAGAGHASVARAQDRYPVVPAALPDSEEIALAESAAPPEVASAATIYAVRAGKVVHLREGTNGCACMVARDLHEGSRYPICFDAEGTRTRLLRELMELRLRMSGRTEDDVMREVQAAYRSGALTVPQVISVTYMMSPRQVLFSSPNADGRRVGAWWPHLMIMGPGLSAKAMGIADSSRITAFSVGQVAEGHATELVVKLSVWSDGTPAKPLR